jgi:hypothetical protein
MHKAKLALGWILLLWALITLLVLWAAANPLAFYSPIGTATVRPAPPTIPWSTVTAWAVTPEPTETGTVVLPAAGRRAQVIFLPIILGGYNDTWN